MSSVELEGYRTSAGMMGEGRGKGKKVDLQQQRHREFMKSALELVLWHGFLRAFRLPWY